MKGIVKCLMLILFLILTIGLQGGWCGEGVKKCEDCPISKPCVYTYVADDGCNTCTSYTWCEKGKWYTDGYADCTLLACSSKFEIENPFKKE